MRLTKAAVLFIAVTLFPVPCYAITIDTVPIGNPGNPADPSVGDPYHPNGVGSVGYAFNIGKTEVTNAQYVAFLSAVAKSDPYALYTTAMTTDLHGGIVRSGPSVSY